VSARLDGLVDANKVASSAADWATQVGEIADALGIPKRNMKAYVKIIEVKLKRSVMEVIGKKLEQDMNARMMLRALSLWRLQDRAGVSRTVAERTLQDIVRARGRGVKAPGLTKKSTATDADDFLNSLVPHEIEDGEVVE